MPKSLLKSEVGHPLYLQPTLDASDALRLPYLRLGCAATYAAIKDLRDEQDRVSLGALMWLILDPLPRLVLECLNFENDSPAILISRGLESIPGRKTGRIKNKKYTQEVT